MKNLAIVGCGAIVQNYHIDAILTLENVRISYVIDSNVERAKALSTHVPNSVQSKTSIGDAKDVEIVFLATPPSVRFDIIKEVPESTEVIIIEKPVAFTYKEFKEIDDWTRAKNIQVFIAQTRRFFPNILAIRDFIEAYHRDFSGSIEIFEGGLFGWISASNHLAKSNPDDGGIIHDVGPHLIDILEIILNASGNSLQNANLISLKADNKHNIHQVRLRAAVKGVEITVVMSRLEQLANIIRIKSNDMELISRSLFDTEINVKKGLNDMIIRTGKNDAVDLKDAFSDMWRSIIEESDGTSKGVYSMKLASVFEQTKFLEKLVKQIKH